MLRKKLMSGYHAELFSYVLHLELADTDADNLAPLQLQDYESVYMSEVEPYVCLVFDRSNHRVNFAVESAKEQFRVHVNCAELKELPEVESTLCGELEFIKEDGTLTRLVPRADIREVLRQLAQSLAKLPS